MTTRNKGEILAGDSVMAFGRRAEVMKVVGGGDFIVKFRDGTKSLASRRQMIFLTEGAEEEAEEAEVVEEEEEEEDDEE